MSAVDDPRQPFQLVLDDLRDAIRRKELKPGDKLPSSRALANKHGVALMTVQRALQQLRDQGVIYTKQGVGSFVHSSAAAHPPKDTGDAPALRELFSLRGRLADVERRLAALENLMEASKAG